MMDNKLELALRYAKTSRKYIYYAYCIVSIYFFVQISMMIVNTYDNSDRIEVMLGIIALCNIVIGMSFIYIQTVASSLRTKIVFCALHMMAIPTMIVISLETITYILPEDGVYVVSDAYVLLVRTALEFVVYQLYGIMMPALISIFIYFGELKTGGVTNG